MKKLNKNLIPLLILVILDSCAPTKKMMRTQDSSTNILANMIYYVNDDEKSSPEILNPPTVFPRQNKFLTPKSKIEVKHNYTPNDIGIKLLISDTKKAESNFTEIQPNSTYIDLFDGEKYTIIKKDVEKTYSVELPNNKFLQVIAFQKSDGTEIMKGYFKIQNSFSFFTGFSSPVLFRVSGNASGFNLNSISPSLGFNLVQMNINKEKFDHVSLDLLLTVTSYPQNLTDSYQYTLAAGGVIDFGGYIQVGSSYSFLEKRPYLVIGIKPYLFSKIFGSQ